MKVLVIGSGGREHALAWGLRQGGAEVHCSPGNAGIAEVAECRPLASPEEAVRYSREREIGLVVIGPEAPLVEGWADVLRGAGLSVFGPGRSGARLEGSKIFAKTFLRTHGIPTADFHAFTSGRGAAAFVRSQGWPSSFRVVKADGLAAGKGVVVATGRDEVLAAIENIMDKRAFGAAGDRIILEAALEGEELSVMALTDGKNIVPLLTTQDHKRLSDNDLGPNTGGMGAYGPVPQVNAALMSQIEREILEPFLAGLGREKIEYRGVIYAGLMLTKEGPKVLEFNVRFGDPETQVILPMGDTDWPGLLLDTANMRLSGQSFRAKAGSAVTVVLAAPGYPGEYQKGLAVEGVTEANTSDAFVFQAGTARGADGRLVNTGGRILAVTGTGSDVRAARERAYAGMSKIHVSGGHYRRDIGARALPETSQK